MYNRLGVNCAPGNTRTFLTPLRQELKVRLAEIDAPEKDRPYGEDRLNIDFFLLCLKSGLLGNLEPYSGFGKPRNL